MVSRQMKLKKKNSSVLFNHLRSSSTRRTNKSLNALISLRRSLLAMPKRRKGRRNNKMIIKINLYPKEQAIKKMILNIKEPLLFYLQLTTETRWTSRDLKPVWCHRQILLNSSKKSLTTRCKTMSMKWRKRWVECPNKSLHWHRIRTKWWIWWNNYFPRKKQNLQILLRLISKSKVMARS